MGNLVDIAYVRNYEMARKLSKFLYEEGYNVGISKVTIETGTHGNHQNWRLDILERPIVAECKTCKCEIEIFEEDKCIQCWTDNLLLENN